MCRRVYKHHVTSIHCMTWGSIVNFCQIKSFLPLCVVCCLICIHTSNCTKYICLTSVTRVKCGVCSTLCWKIGNISGSTELFGLKFADSNLKLPNLSIHTLVMLEK